MNQKWRRFTTTPQLGFATVLLGMTLLLSYGDWLWRADKALYDANHTLLTRETDNQIVIVAIDEFSLDALGRWPWPRQRHAELLDQLTRAGAGTIILDVIFAEPDTDQPANDTALAAAIQHHGRVILPLLVEQRQLGGQLLETLPLPQLSTVAAGLGHAHIELDADGIARSVFLQEGLGRPRWPHIAVAALQAEQPSQWQQLPGQRSPGTEPHSPYLLMRDHQMLIPFAGPPGHYPRISYAHVLEGRYLADTFRGKTVLIGTTATGLGDVLPTPVSGFNQPMPGVEINANIIDALRHHLAVEPLGFGSRLGLSLLIILVPVLLFPRLSPRNALLTAGGLLLGTLTLSALLLSQLQYWFPPAAVIMPLLLAYPLWSWQRLEYASRFLTQEVQRLHDEPSLTEAAPIEDMASVMPFIRQQLPLNGWGLYDATGNTVAAWGTVPERPAQTTPEWHSPRTGEWWLALEQNRQHWSLGIDTGLDTPPTAAQESLLRTLIQPWLPSRHQEPASTIERFENRVLAVQEAVMRLQVMRRFINDSLSQMADGVMVINSLGQIILINPKAISYFGLQCDPQSLQGHSAIELLNTLNNERPERWEQLLAVPLRTGEIARSESRSRNGRDLLVQCAPLSLEQQQASLVINLSDITYLLDIERARADTLRFLSHDLRAPLVSLLALADLARHPTPSIDQNELITRVEEHARTTLDLAEEFLNLSQIEGALHLELRPVEITTIALNAIDAIWAQAHAKQITLTEELPDEPLYTLADPSVLQRVVVNLLSNAVKYGRADSEVKLSVHCANGTIECAIQDQGEGISAADQERLFERFYRTRSAIDSNIQGTGLGLAFVKGAMEKLGGSVSVSSVVGEGSRFAIRLPELIEPQDE